MLIEHIVELSVVELHVVELGAEKFAAFEFAAFELAADELAVVELAAVEHGAVELPTCCRTWCFLTTKVRAQCHCYFFFLTSIPSTPKNPKLSIQSDIGSYDGARTWHVVKELHRRVTYVGSMLCFLKKIREKIDIK
jgi:hypothetical protein